MISASRIYDSTRLIIRDPDDQRYGVARFCDALNEAMSDFTNNVDYFIKEQYSLVPPNYNSVDFSERAVKLVRVEYIDLQRSIQKRLALSNYELLDKDYGDWRTNTSISEPLFYIPNKQNVCNFFVYPLAELPNVNLPKFGIISSSDVNLNLTDERGVIEALDRPFLKITYAELQQRVIPNPDESATGDNRILFDGTTTAAKFNIQEDIVHTLKHYCASIMFSDDNDELQQQLSATQLALYNRKLEQVQDKKDAMYVDDLIPVPYMTGTNDSDITGGNTGYGDNYGGNY